MKKKALASAGVFLIFVSMFVFVSGPGLSGGFVLDDWPNLSSLADVNAQGFWGVVFEGVSSTLGRPVSVFSFALQAADWPENPFFFKAVNLLIHVINSGLVFLLTYSLYTLCRPTSNYHHLFAISVCLIWLFLPLHASTTFYVVQRMTLLSASFSLLGVWVFAWGLGATNGKEGKKPLISVSIIVSFAYLVGILSKENAILVALLLPLCVVFLSCRDVKVPAHWKAWLVVFSFLPTAALFAYLLKGDRYLGGYAIRHFTLDERLLTELRILWDYVFNVYFPTNHRLNIYNDGYQISRSLMAPVSTLISLVGWLAAILLAIAKRKQWPFLFFGLFWFLGGHLLESTFVGLELYFEHRNYLPSLGLVLIVVGSLFHYVESRQEQNESDLLLDAHQSITFRLGFTLLLVWFVWSAIVLGGEAKSWSNPRLMAIASLGDRPDSLRANQDAVAYYANSGDYRNAAMLLHHIDQRWPGYPGTLAQQMLVNCFDERVLLPPFWAALKRFRDGPMDRGAVPTFDEILQLKKANGCVHFSWSDYRALLDALKENQKFSGQKENILVLLAYSYNAESLFREAADVLVVGALNKPSIGYMLLSAQFSAMAGSIDKAQEIIRQIRINYPQDSKSWILHSDKVELLEQQLALAKEATK